MKKITQRNHPRISMQSLSGHDLCYHPGPLLTKRADVLLQDRVMSRSQDIRA